MLSPNSIYVTAPEKLVLECYFYKPIIEIETDLKLIFLQFLLKFVGVCNELTHQLQKYRLCHFSHITKTINFEDGLSKRFNYGTFSHLVPQEDSTLKITSYFQNGGYCGIDTDRYSTQIIYSCFSSKRFEQQNYSHQFFNFDYKNCSLTIHYHVQEFCNILSKHHKRKEIEEQMEFEKKKQKKNVVGKENGRGKAKEAEKELERKNEIKKLQINFVNPVLCNIALEKNPIEETYNGNGNNNFFFDDANDIIIEERESLVAIDQIIDLIKTHYQVDSSLLNHLDEETSKSEMKKENSNNNKKYNQDYNDKKDNKYKEKNGNGEKICLKFSKKEEFSFAIEQILPKLTKSDYLRTMKILQYRLLIFYHKDQIHEILDQIQQSRQNIKLKHK
ncbi:hypothetical protein M0812_00834 [Anaeramoeba flamelloides]|uniref:Uncharacterized protein n=1 Tax=Anaeramoeba flamelloides TaxID=1746091 RepID=A0AAV8A439_9EUKA|nr:hypothetical protein M0812_00834 [Anaeramoeba flamelloides]